MAKPLTGASVEDDSRKRIIAATALHLGEWLQASGMLEKKIWQLQRTELEAMTDVAVSAFLIEETRERERRDLEVLPPLNFTV